MSKNLKSITKIVLPILILFSVLASCKQGDPVDNSDIPSSHSSVVMVDTFSLNLSTVKLDSFITASQSELTMGVANDPYSGIVNAHSDFIMGVPSTNKLSSTTTMVLDSMILDLKPEATYYGDSSQNQTLNLYQLKDIYYSTNAVKTSNKDSLPISGNAIATYTGKVQPLNGDHVRLRFTDDFANSMFTLLKNNDDKIRDNNDFLEAFRGFSIRGASNNSLIFTSSFSDSTCNFIVYYHNGSLTENNKDSVVFSPTATTQQYVTTSVSRSGSLLSNFTDTLPSSSTSHLAIANSMAYTAVNVEVPNLSALQNTSLKIGLLKAVLTIIPEVGSYEYGFPLPGSLYAGYMATDKKSFTYLTTSGTTQSGSISVNNLFPEQTKYQFDVTTYIKKRITELNTTEHSQLLILTNYSLPEVYRLAIPDQQYSNTNTRIKLQLYLYQYEQ